MIVAPSRHCVGMFGSRRDGYDYVLIFSNFFARGKSYTQPLCQGIVDYEITLTPKGITSASTIEVMSKNGKLDRFPAVLGSLKTEMKNGLM